MIGLSSSENHKKRKDWYGMTERKNGGNSERNQRKSRARTKRIKGRACAFKSFKERKGAAGKRSGRKAPY